MTERRFVILMACAAAVLLYVAYALIGGSAT
jgi:hypothetical protein